MTLTTEEQHGPMSAPTKEPDLGTEPSLATTPMKLPSPVRSGGWHLLLAPSSRQHAIDEH
jgi:hypothetical protein